MRASGEPNSPARLPVPVPNHEIRAPRDCGSGAGRGRGAAARALASSQAGASAVVSSAVASRAATISSSTGCPG
jgi:hypothetical protein